ncbi:macrophage mannose receptor 1-like isoform X2 [Varanus komodoensis]|uniref:macrophage mannose receptor 1-like isoform X2 n=1 Tax=Varanus komodoensis TaxID=61221 RepID=UPI001CF77D04|nr:macrophage mannose receptor 1-like isoform X2 [Varanus komodoensis]
MPALWFLTFLLFFQPAFQVSESDSFLIYNGKFKMCVQVQRSRAIILDYCNAHNEWQQFKWASEGLILNMGVKLCLAVPSKANLVPVKLSPCNRTSELQQWGCKNGTLVALNGDFFLHSADGRKSQVMLSKTPNTNSAWTIYGTKDGLCSKGYEGGNAFGAPCEFPFKYMNKWHATCIKDGDEDGRLWCGTTADVNKDSLTGYCPVKDKDELFWTKNHWTGDLYQINDHSALTWYEARKSCQQQNAELLSIGELHEQTYLTGITSSMTSDYWIGLNNLDFDSGWQWMDNHPLRYLNWAPGSPSSETEKICGLMVAHNGKWKNEKCSQQLGYICKRANSSSDASVIPSDPTKTVKCPDGWVGYVDHCYHLNREPKTWRQALLSCQKDGGDLISIHNIEEYSFVISQLGYRPTDVLWIGLNDRKTQMYFEWSDGAPVRFTKWQRGEPTHISDVQEDCVTMSGENGFWADYFCEEELGYICKREPLASLPEEAETADPNCKKGWKRHNLHCYFIGQTPVIFSEAKSFCEANEASLTSVQDRYEQAYLTSLVGLHSAKYFWIGLSDVDQPGTFNWTNGEHVLFTHWNARMPGQQSGCVAMRTGTAAGLWDVVSCEEKAPFLCKQWAEGVTPPPALTTTPPPSCPEGWSPSPTRDICIKAFLDEKKHRKNWFEALDFCRALGGDLISFHSNEELIMVGRWNIKEAWIGLRRLDPEEGYSWSDGSPLDLQPRTLFPYLRSENKQCSVIYRFGLWLPFLCEILHPWICQIKRGVPLKPEPRNDLDFEIKIIEDGWIAYGNKEYYFSNASVPAEKARTFCKRHSGDLVVIESESERNFLHKYSVIHVSSMKNPYIGLILGLDKKFGWMDGSPVTYEAWANDEPNFANDDENCVVMYLNTGLWNDLNCGVEQSFICERHNSSVRPTVAPTMPAPLAGCAEGWLWFDNKCFQIFGFHEDEKKNWSDARTDCRNRGGNLVTISSKAVQAFLTMHLKNISANAWIGLNDINWDRHYLWTDGTGVYYTDWGKGFPDHHGDCVFINAKPERLAGNWRNQYCKTKKSYICQKNVDPALPHHETTIPASGYVPYGNSSYSLASPKMTWEEARRKCRSEGAELARVLTPYVQSFLWLQVLKYGEPVWIGLNSNMMNESYKWINKWKLKYTQWAPEEPKEKIACVYLDLDGHWKTGNCNEKHFSVCEKYYGIDPTEIPEGPGRCPMFKKNQIPWIPFRSHCYAIYPGRETWSKSSMKCSQLGATLTSIRDLAEQKFLMEHTEQLNHMDFWIGMFKNIEGEWIWQDNTAVDFVNWKENQSLTNDQANFEENAITFHSDCVFMNGHTGEWFKNHCNYNSRGFICKTNKNFEVSPSKASVKKDDLRDGAAASPGKTAMVVLLVLLSLAIGGTIFYIYRRRLRQPQTASFNNTLYQDNEIILQSDSELLVNDKEQY